MWIKEISLILTQFSPTTSGSKYAFRNHGMPKHSRMSNVFELIELLMPIAPCPWFVTITLETASGKLVPAAKNVSPITESGTLAVSPNLMCNRSSNKLVSLQYKIYKNILIKWCLSVNVRTWDTRVYPILSKEHSFHWQLIYCQWLSFKLLHTNDSDKHGYGIWCKTNPNDAQEKCEHCQFWVLPAIGHCKP